MEILKKALLTAVIILVSLFSWAQNEKALQNAFNESYNLEYEKKYNEAINSINKLYDDKSYEINLRLGWLHYNNKNYTQSANYYQKSATLRPYSIEAKIGLVKPLAAMESWDKVLQQYDEILKIDPQNYTANYWAGVIYYNRKKYEVSVKYFEKIVNLYPFDYDANHMMAWSCLNSGRINDAKTLFNKALMIKPGDASCIEGLGKIK